MDFGEIRGQRENLGAEDATNWKLEKKQWSRSVVSSIQLPVLLTARFHFVWAINGLNIVGPYITGLIRSSSF